MKTHMLISFTFCLSYYINEKQKLNKEHEWQETEYTFQTTFLLSFANKNSEKQKKQNWQPRSKNPPQIKKKLRYLIEGGWGKGKERLGWFLETWNFECEVLLEKSKQSPCCHTINRNSIPLSWIGNWKQGHRLTSVLEIFLSFKPDSS